MMLLSRPEPLIAVAGALLLATAGIAVQGRQQPAPAGAPEQPNAALPPAAAPVPDIAANRALAKEQLALVDEALASLEALARTGRVSPTDPPFALWGRRRVEALRRTGAGKAEIVAALEKYIAGLEQEEAITRRKREEARATVVEVYDARFRHMEAEIWLNEEKAR